MKYALATILLVVHIVFGQPDYLLEGGWGAALSYSFFHANIFHLAINCFSMYILYKACKDKVFCKEMLLAYIVSIVVFPLSLKPIVGISNMLYAVIGMRTPPFSHPWWKLKTTIQFLVITLLMVFIPSISATTHIASFAIGVILAYGRRFIKNTNDDYRRATHS